MTKITEVTCALIIEDGRVLVTQRSERMSHPLKWEFPGGKVKQGETARKCIEREIREELGIEVMVKKRLPSLSHAYPSRVIRLIPFICEQAGGTLNLAEHSSSRWVPLDRLDEVDWLDADRELVRVLGRQIIQEGP